MEDENQLLEPWRSYIDHAQHLHESGQFDNALSVLTVCENDLLSHMLKVLDVQALVHTKKGDYVKAHESAQVMIHIAPWEPSGYLRRTEIYFARHQSQNAYKALEDDLKYLPREWKCYPELERRKRQINSFHKDIIAHIPYDLLHEVFKWVSVPKILTVCMVVSKTWRYRLQDCKPVWSEININHLIEHDIKLQEIVKVAPYIRKVRMDLDLVVGRKWLTSFWQFVDRGILEGIEHVTWKISGAKIKFDPSWKASFARLSRTLTSLTIGVPASPITLPFIIQTFPKLEKLTYSNNHIFGPLDNTVPLAPSLRTLAIFIPIVYPISPEGFRAVPAAELESLLPSFPNLRSLTVRPCQPISLSLLDKHCPHIENVALAILFIDSAELPRPRRAEDRVPGLHTLQVEPNDFDDFEKFLQRHSHTLEELYISLKSLMGQANIPRALSGVKFNRLRSLKFSSRPDLNTDTATLESILQDKPSLDEFALGDMSSISPDVFHLLGRHSCKSLQFLSLNTIASLRNFDHLLAVLADQGAACKLREVHFEDIDLTNIQLTGLGMIPTLEKIALSRYQGRFPYDSDCLMEFFKKQAKYQRLRDIIVFGANVNLDVLNLIGDIVTLETLSIDKQEDIERVNILEFLEKNPHINVDQDFSDDEDGLYFLDDDDEDDYDEDDYDEEYYEEDEYYQDYYNSEYDDDEDEDELL